MWYQFVSDLLGVKTMFSKTSWYCSYRNYRMEDFFAPCDIDEEDIWIFWEPDNDNFYVRLHP